MKRRKFVSSGLASSLLASTNANALVNTVQLLEGAKTWKGIALFNAESIGQVFLNFKQDLFTKNRIDLDFIDVQSALSNPAESIADVISGKYDLAIVPPFALNYLGPEAEYFGQYSHLSATTKVEDWHQRPEIKNFWNTFFTANNLVPFHFGRCENGGLWSKQKIKSMTDFLKLRMRLMGHAQEDFSSLGGSSKFSTYTSISDREQNRQIDASEGFSPHLDTNLHFENGFNYYYVGWPKQIFYMGLFVKKSSYESLSSEEKNNLANLISTYHEKLTLELAAKDKAVLQKLAAASPEFVQSFPNEVTLALKEKYQARLAALKVKVPVG